MHAAPLTSDRLQRVLRLLSDGRAHTTRDIARRTHVLAISAVVAELRSHGAAIICERQLVGASGGSSTRCGAARPHRHHH
jgi:hypothetical protein